MIHYSLEWLGKEEAILEAKTPCKIEEKIHFCEENLLIKGDNLDALKRMHEAYKNKIDVIYIDPPYNTKNHKFLYKDNFCTGDSDSHSRWLSFMYPRIFLACGMLRQDGVLFVSIDDNEVAQLKLLCDEIFGEDNFISQITWQKKRNSSFLHKNVAKVSEYILVYAKDIQNAPILSIEESQKHKPYPLNFKNNAIKEILFQAGSVRFRMQNQIVKACDMSSANIKCSLLDDVEIKNNTNIYPFRMLGSWRYSQNILDNLVQNGAVLSVAKTPWRVNYIMQQSKKKLMRNLFTQESYQMQTNEDGLSQIIELFGFEAFSKPKPLELIKTLIKSVTHAKKDALVLDFFAGSASTAHAVMELNAQDGEKRRYILIQSGEKLNKNSAAFAHGYKNIFEITKERILLAISKNNFKNEMFQMIKLK